jgi:hypothetical protein
MLVYSLFGDYFSFFEQQIFFWLFVAVVLTAPTHPDCYTVMKSRIYPSSLPTKKIALGKGIVFKS